MNPTINAENNETFLTPGGILQTIRGKSHAQGGTDITVEPGTKIFSQKLKFPKEIVADILGKKKTDVTKMSPAELSKKFPTEKYIDTLKSEKDQYAKNTALINLNKNLGSLETIFQAQEKFKQDNGLKDGQLMTKSQESQVNNNPVISAQVGVLAPELLNNYPLYEPYFGSTPIIPNTMGPNQEREGLFFNDTEGNIVEIPFFGGKAIPKVEQTNTGARLTYPEVPVTSTRNVFGPSDFVSRGSRNLKANQQAYANRWGYDLGTNKYLDTPEAKEKRWAEASIYRKGSGNTYSTTHNAVVFEDGKPIGQLFNRGSQYGNLPVISDEQFQQYYMNPKYDIQNVGTSNYKGNYSNFAIGDPRNASYEWDDAQGQVQIKSTTPYSYQEDLNYVVPKSDNLPPKPLKEVVSETKQELPIINQPEIRLRELEELKKAQVSNAFDLAFQKKKIPYLNSVTQVPAYQRFIPVNTLAAERGQNLLNGQLDQTSGQMAQAVQSDNYAKLLDAQNQINIQNSQRANDVNNQNSQVFNQVYNQNKLNEAQAMSQYAKENQMVEDQFDYERDRIRSNARQLSLNEARILDRMDAERALGKITGNPYLPSEIIRRKNRLYQTIEQNPDNRYTNKEAYGWLNDNESPTKILDQAVTWAKSKTTDPKEAEQYVEYYLKLYGKI